MCKPRSFARPFTASRNVDSGPAAWPFPFPWFPRVDAVPVTITKSPATTNFARLRSLSACNTDNTAALVSGVDSPCTSTSGRRAVDPADLEYEPSRLQKPPFSSRSDASMKSGANAFDLGDPDDVSFARPSNVFAVPSAS